MTRTRFILIVALAGEGIFRSAGGTIVVPNEAETQDGNDSTLIPFLSQSIRYQQVFDTSQFSAVPAGGAFITGISFRGDCILNDGGSTMTNLQISFSTTSKGPDQLSTTLSSNVGPDATLVFGPGTYSVGGGSPDCQGGFFSGLAFKAPFYFDPARGNLLMDLRSDGVIPFNPPFFAGDAVNVMGDSVSRAYGIPSSTNRAAQVDTVGLPTQFQFNEVPSLTNSFATNTLKITWPTQPKNFRLFSSGGVSSNANWQPVPTNQITGNDLFQTLTLPVGLLTNARFFQLRCISCTTNSPFAQARNSVSTELH